MIIRHIMILFAIVFATSIVMDTMDTDTFAQTITIVGLVIIYPFIPLYYNLFKACKEL